MEIFAKLLLSLDLQVRGLRSILLDCVAIATSSMYIQKGSEATKKWNDAYNKLKEDGATPKAAKGQLGLPHVHLWNALLGTFKERATKAQNQPAVQQVTEYLEQAQPLGVKGMASVVKFVRINKMYSSEHKRLEVNVKPDTIHEKMWHTIRADILTLPESNHLEGMAPPGDLTRKVQEWLDNKEM